jgi:kynurenine formamidase
MEMSLKLIDLTQTLKPSMPVYPGTEPPIFVKSNTIDDDGFAEKKITMYSHTGTHVDSPAHMLKEKSTLDQLDIDTYRGNAFVINVSHLEGKTIEQSFIAQFVDEIKKAEFVLFYTGWDERWGSPGYFEDFPVLTVEAAKYLCSLNLKGLGFDCISVDEVGDTKMNNHKMIFSYNMIIIENLCHLRSLVGSFIQFSCFPLKIENADGSPVRAVGMIV